MCIFSSKIITANVCSRRHKEAVIHLDRIIPDAVMLQHYKLHSTFLQTDLSFSPFDMTDVSGNIIADSIRVRVGFKRLTNDAMLYQITKSFWVATYVVVLFYYFPETWQVTLTVKICYL